jgi:hypothetical protein
VDEQLAFMKMIAQRLESAGIAYMVTGSLAMTLYAIPRLTRDIDIVIECRPEDADRIGKLFEADCYIDRESIREAITRRTMFNIIHSQWIIKADFIVRKKERYREVEFGRRRKFQLEGMNIFVVAPEDLILSKLIWSLESDSEIQKRDALSIAKSVTNLDWTYLKKWAQTLDLEDLLDEVT